MFLYWTTSQLLLLVARNGLWPQMNPKQVYRGEGWQYQCGDFPVDRHILSMEESQQLEGAF